MGTPAAYEEQPCSGPNCEYMDGESRTYSNVDRTKFESLRSAIAVYAKLPEGDNGSIESQGMRGRYDYDPQAQTLTVTLEEVPFFIPRSMIWNVIENALQK